MGTGFRAARPHQPSKMRNGYRFSQGSLGKVLPPPVRGLRENGLGWSPRKPPSAAPLKMHEHPFCTHGSLQATPLIAQSPPTAHIWEGDNGSTGPRLSQAPPWGMPLPLPLQEGAIRVEGWTLSCSCGLSGGRRGSDRSDVVTFRALRLRKRNRKSRNDPFPPSFIQQAQSRAWVNRWQMAAVLIRRNCVMLGTVNSESYTTLALSCAGTRLMEEPPIVKHLPHPRH